MRLHGLRCSVFGEQGDCPKLLLSGRTCSPKCSRAGYSLVGVTSCNNGELIPAACQAAACDTRTPPRSGTSGTCGPSLASGETCAPSCNDGFALSVVSRCVAGMLTAATCERVSNRCSKETAPVGCFNKGRTCQECCSSLSLSSDCWDVSAGITFSACCNSCLNQAPANGVLGSSCALVLPDRTTCVPECNPGFQLLGTRAARAASFLRRRARRSRSAISRQAFSSADHQTVARASWTRPSMRDSKWRRRRLLPFPI